MVPIEGCLCEWDMNFLRAKIVAVAPACPFHGAFARRQERRQWLRFEIDKLKRELDDLDKVV